MKVHICTNIIEPLEEFEFLVKCAYPRNANSIFKKIVLDTPVIELGYRLYIVMLRTKRADSL